MRQLTKKQKKILDNYRNISRLEDLPDGVFEKLEKINDTETRARLLYWVNSNPVFANACITAFKKITEIKTKKIINSKYLLFLLFL